MPPVVSVCLPCKNTRPFLEERIQSILTQTFTDWELIVVDDYSSDGSWEYFFYAARNNTKINLFRGPNLGLYAGWNDAIRRAQGEFVYIATSDDTMRSDCLETMVAALRAHPDCGLCQCRLDIIQADGEIDPDLDWRKFTFGRFANEWLDKIHIRRAPLDGFLHCALQTVYTSVTQLLIRRELFDHIGLFRTDCGSIADFEWGMRAGFSANVVYLPYDLASWRLHPAQATDTTESSHNRRQLKQLVVDVLRGTNTLMKIYLSDSVMRQLVQFYEEQEFLFLKRESGAIQKKILFILRTLLQADREAWRWVVFCLPRLCKPEELQFHRLRMLIDQAGIPWPEFVE